MDNRGIDTDPGWINRKLRDLEAKIEAMRSERRAAATTVSTGAFVVSSEGEEIFRIGDMEFGDRGVVIRRQNGTVAFEVRRLSAGAFVSQSTAIRDNNGASALETDALFGGVRAPYLEYTFQPIAAASGTTLTCGPYGFERTTTSTTFDTLFVYDGKRQNPYLDLKVAVKPSDTSTSAEVRVVNLATGTPLSDFFGGGSWLGTVPTGSSAFTLLDPSATQAVAADAGAYQAAIRLGVQVRRTAGSGTLTVSVPQAIGG